MPSRMQRRVTDEFTVWASAQGIVPDGEVGQRWRERITVLLQGRADYLDKSDPTRWRSGDVHDRFMTYVVPRQVDAWDLAEQDLDTNPGLPALPRRHRPAAPGCRRCSRNWIGWRREGERKEPPAELAAQMAEMNKLSIGEPEFFDLKQPWLYSPR